jgi:hypothetical protein
MDMRTLSAGIPALLAGAILLIPICQAATSPAQLAANMSAGNVDSVIQRAGAKPTMRVGDGTIHADRLRPYANAWLVTLRSKSGAIYPGKIIWSETLDEHDVDGRKTFWWNSGGTAYRNPHGGFKTDEEPKMQVYSNIDIFDAETLAPIRSLHHFSNDDILRVTVEGAHAVWSHATKEEGPWETHPFDLPAPAYDLDGGFFAVLAPLVDLRVGNSGVIPSVGTKDSPVVGYPFRVVRKEKIDAGNYGRVDTTVVEIYEPRTGELFSFWVIDKPPYVLRFTVPGEDYDQDFEELGFTGPIDWDFAR